jgi:hypothetical protein
MKFDKVWRIRRDIRQLLYNHGRPAEDLRILARRLGRLLNKKYKTNFHWLPTKVLGRNHLVFSGTYDCYEKDRPITIWINTHPASVFYTFGYRGKVSWKRFVDDLSECIMHEKVHEFQWRSRRYKKKARQKLTGNQSYDYYADSDEIDAYAWSLASECLDRNTDGRILDVLESSYRDFSVWWKYANLFEMNHPTRKKLLKKTYLRVQLALGNDVN